MDEAEQIKKLLKQNLAVSEESFKILKKMHRAQSIGRFFGILKWTTILLLAMGSYYYIQPFVRTFWNTVSELRADFSRVNEAGGVASPDFFEGVKNFLGEPR